MRTPTGVLEVRGANRNNLRDVDVDIPLGVLVAVTGVAGSGKSSLVDGSLAGREGVVAIDQSPIRGSRRSNPATYTGLLDPIRKAFAKANGVKPALFSANSEGACPTCKGAGVVYTDLGIMAEVATTCEDCEGRRFHPSVLEHRLGGRDIAEVLAMSVDEAAALFADGEARTPAAHRVLQRLADVGLGYLTLGQPLTTLSGGERQRLKLAAQMGDGSASVHILDEPTSGLHLADVEQLLGLLDRLVDSGRSVIVVEHHQAVVAHADWIIDLGPGAGHDGGRVVFEGTPADLVASRATLTGWHLADYVGVRPGRDHRPARAARASRVASSAEEGLDGDLVEGDVPGRAEDGDRVEERQLAAVDGEPQRHRDVVGGAVDVAVPARWRRVRLELGQQLGERRVPDPLVLAAHPAQQPGPPPGAVAQAAGQALGVQRGPQHVERRARQRRGQVGEEALHGPVGGEHVPADVHRHGGVGLVAGEHGVDRGPGRPQVGEGALRVGRCQSRGQVDLVAVAQGHVELVADPLDHRPARRRPPGLDVAEVAGRDPRGHRHVELRPVPPRAPPPDEGAGVAVGGHAASVLPSPAAGQ